ncbi:hypothetical protein JTE90_020616 [Oedothorax gibbosus]|uniref:Uncharacterized protein n=1 Tax=Oedothorax gibbosus TaxID=931172 RepID=A0AAV6TTX7_9ARAC|nr:hypothetical protein JTE90_020616 [Oedothorax gibbosus]
MDDMTGRQCVVPLYYHQDTCQPFDGDWIEFARGETLCIPMRRDQFADFSGAFFKERSYPASSLQVSGQWKTGAGGGKASFSVPLWGPKEPHLRYVLNAKEWMIDLYRNDAFQMCNDMLNWTEPYRFDLVRSNYVRLRFLRPVDLTESRHWSLFTELKRDAFKKLVDRIMNEMDWTPTQAYFCMIGSSCWGCQGVSATPHLEEKTRRTEGEEENTTEGEEGTPTERSKTIKESGGRSAVWIVGHFPKSSIVPFVRVRVVDRVDFFHRSPIVQVIRSFVEIQHMFPVLEWSTLSHESYPILLVEAHSFPIGIGIEIDL